MSTSIDAHMLAVPIRPPSGPLSYVWYVACGRYRGWLALLVVGEALNATCGILLPYALSRILTGVSHGSADPPAALAALWPPLHSHRFLSENFAGALAHRISEASQGVTQTLWTLITEFWPIAIVISVANGLLLSANWWLGGFLSCWSVIFITVSFLLARRCQPYCAGGGRGAQRDHRAHRRFGVQPRRRPAVRPPRLRTRAARPHPDQGARGGAALEPLHGAVRWFQFGSASHPQDRHGGGRLPASGAPAPSPSASSSWR
jgi:hypothetical protein